MSNGNTNKITNEAYADLLISYNGDLSILERFGTDYTIINDRFALGHIPISEVTPAVIKEYGWSVIPTCFGLVDSSSLDASGITRIQNIPFLGLKGQGVLVGFVDTGIEYTNQVFKNQDNTTRIISIWDQNIDNPDQWPEGIPYGSEYKREQINLALKNEHPLDIVPSTDENGHGTMLAGVAAGSKVQENNFVGVVPDAELIIVKLKPAKKYLKQFFFIPEDAVCYQQTDIAFGVRYLLDFANKLNRPIAICIGLGTTSGFHDGRGELSVSLSLAADRAGTAVVVAGGNEGNSKGHYYGNIDNTIGYDTVELKVGKNDNGFTMEVWGYPPNIYSIDILSPSGEYIARIPARLGESRVVRFIFEQTQVFIDYRLVEYQTGAQLILLRFQKPTEGIWRMKVYATGNKSIDFHIWLPMKKFLSSDTFFTRANPDTTITSPGNAVFPITVTAYDHTTGSLYTEASRGFTTNNQIKPDFAAPGVNIYSPTINNSFTSSTGTSVAAAHTTGVAAMLLEWGIIRGNLASMDTAEIKNFLIRGAKRDSGTDYPNKEWGFGILDLFNSFETFRNEGV